MSIHWQSRQEYLHFLYEAKVHPDTSRCTALPSLEEVFLLYRDPFREHSKL